MGYVPAPPPPRLNLDRHGLPRDFATYMWVTYRRHVTDDSPARRAFLYGPVALALRDRGLDFGQQTMMG